MRVTTADVTGIVGLVNFLGCFLGIYILSRVGRKELMLKANFLMTSLLFIMGSAQLKNNTALSLICLALFLVCFECSSGPVTWLYMAEILQDKSFSIATVLNWVIKIIISFAIPMVLKVIGTENVGYIFLSTGILTFLSTLFIFFYMKETKGLSRNEIDKMYN